MSKQGARNDLLELAVCPEKIIDLRPDLFIKYHSGISKLIMHKNMKKLNEYIPEMHVTVIVG